MTDAKTVSAKYLYLDIVGYTLNRSVEVQTDIIDCLNGIVKSAIVSFNLEKSKILYIPTGDGICIALLDINDPYDIHLQESLSIVV